MLRFRIFLLCISNAFIFAPIPLINANENTVFLYNCMEHCKPSEYYDVNYFMCRECDSQLNLVPSENGEIESTEMKPYHYVISEKNRIFRVLFWIGSSIFGTFMCRY